MAKCRCNVKTPNLRNKEKESVMILEFEKNILPLAFHRKKMIIIKDTHDHDVP